MPTPSPLTAQISGFGKSVSASIIDVKWLPWLGECRIGDPRLHLVEVVAGAERPSAAGQQHHRDVGIVGGLPQRDRRRLVERFVEGVEHIGPVRVRVRTRLSSLICEWSRAAA